ncbi:MAG: hypothetical protein KF878_06655 [Planctomycetes bacterium]|nr:hypothetical protein [Planctomycetota bacterium]
MTTAILGLAAVWHGLATWHFGVTPARTLARATSERPVSAIATELFRFLAGLNAALVVLAAAALFAGHEARLLALLTLAAANLSQLVLDLRVRRLGLARGPMFARILVGDALFTALCGGALAVGLAG